MKKIFTMAMIIIINMVAYGQQKQSISDSTVISQTRARMVGIEQKISNYQKQLQEDPSASFSRESQLAILETFMGTIKLMNGMVVLYEKNVKSKEEAMENLKIAIEQFDKLKKTTEELIKENEQLKKKEKQ
jgi:hypothetical protein